MTDSRFTREQRLLGSEDYKAVFDQNSFRIGNNEFLLLARPSSFARSRLGLVVSKKNSKRAIDRNTIKRVIRESFRQKVFPSSVDLVVLTRQGVRNSNKTSLMKSINSIWARLEKKMNESAG